MINFVDEEKEGKKIFSIDLLKVVIPIVLAIGFTYLIINFIPFINMFNEFKIAFKTNTLEQIVKYYSFTLAIIVIPIYTVLYFAFHALVKFIFEKVKSQKEA